MIKDALENRVTLSPSEWCSLHGIGRTTLYKMWKDGTGPEYVMFGSRRRIPKDALPKQPEQKTNHGHL